MNLKEFVFSSRLKKEREKEKEKGGEAQLLKEMLRRALSARKNKAPLGGWVLLLLCSVLGCNWDRGMRFVHLGFYLYVSFWP